MEFSPRFVSENKKFREDMVAFGDLLARWSRRHALYRGDFRRYAEDSLFLVELLRHRNEDLAILDMGSGSGWPGIILGIALKFGALRGTLTLAERSLKRVSFLLTCVSTLDLSSVVQIHQGDVRSLSGHYDVVSARAVAPLPQLLDLTYPHLLPLGRAFFFKGFSYGKELWQARKRYIFSHRVVPRPLEMGCMFEIWELRKY